MRSDGGTDRTGLIGVLGLSCCARQARMLYLRGPASWWRVDPLPARFLHWRMSTIQGYQSDSSAKVRIAVWGWTWNYVQEHPLGGGFGAYRGNKIEVRTVTTQGDAGVQTITARTDIDQGRAYHSAYFEMLGEQGFPGLALFLLIHIIGLVRMEVIRRRYRKAEDDKAWIAPLATALQHFQIIYLVGASFVAIAYTPFTLMMLGVADRPGRSSRRRSVPSGLTRRIRRGRCSVRPGVGARMSGASGRSARRPSGAHRDTRLAAWSWSSTTSRLGAAPHLPDWPISSLEATSRSTCFFLLPGFVRG